MKFGRYLAVMASSWALAAAAVIGFNMVVDAMGISPVRIAIAGFNEWKPLREQHDRVVKRYDVWRNQPTTIFIGSSRIKQTVDPRLVAGAAFRSSVQWRGQWQRRLRGNQIVPSILSRGRQEFALRLHRGLRYGTDLCFWYQAGGPVRHRRRHRQLRNSIFFSEWFELFDSYRNSKSGTKERAGCRLI